MCLHPTGINVVIKQCRQRALCMHTHPTPPAAPLAAAESRHFMLPPFMLLAVEVQKMLLAEEVAAHKQHASSGQAAISSSAHAALLKLLDAATHQQALLQHADCVLAPALAAMQQLRLQQELQVQQLQADNQRMQVGGHLTSGK